MKVLFILFWWFLFGLSAKSCVPAKSSFMSNNGLRCKISLSGKLMNYDLEVVREIKCLGLCRDQSSL